MSKLDEMSKELAAKALKKDDSFAIDPMTILMIADILIKVIKFVLEWYNNNKANSLKSMKGMNFFKRVMIQRVIRKHVKDPKQFKIACEAVEQLVYVTSDKEKETLLDLVLSENKK